VIGVCRHRAITTLGLALKNDLLVGKVTRVTVRFEDQIVSSSGNAQQTTPESYLLATKKKANNVKNFIFRVPKQDRPVVCAQGMRQLRLNRREESGRG
jgi:hypothetical protein